MQDGWKYYNHALIPTVEPHIECTPPKTNRTFWNNRGGGGYSLFARWTSEFDCGHETNFWYVIKDTPFDIASLKAKRRYEINKGKKNFSVKRINASKYVDSLLAVTKNAFLGWPEKYRPQIDENSFRNGIEAWNSKVIYGGFDNETGQLRAYSYLTEYPEHFEFNVLRAYPESEKKGINAAMVVAIIEDYNERLGHDFYINDGARSIRHETAFQDYLEKYFGFRKAYCKLNIKYRVPFGAFVKVLYPFKNLVNKKTKIGSLFDGVMLMEDIRRNVN